MAKQTTYKNISRRARSLLADRDANTVEYLAKIRSLKAEDLVAFANSQQGGAILIGVKTVKEKNGAQKGEPASCPITNANEQQIMAKALSCSPPVKVDIISENTGDQPFYRVEIPSGDHKPYSTEAGTYQIRYDGKNTPLQPKQLLSMLLGDVTDNFIDKLATATGKLENRIHETLGMADGLEFLISEKMEEISHATRWTKHNTGDTANALGKVEHAVGTIQSLAKKQNDRIKALLSHLAATDPVAEKAEKIKQAEKAVFDYLLEQFSQDQEFLNAIKAGHTMTFPEGTVGELTKDDISRILALAVKTYEARETRTKQHYSS